MNDIITFLQDKDNKKAYALSKEISAKSVLSDEYYKYFDEFIDLLNHKNSYVRTRGFSLACSQAKWDKNGKLAGAMKLMFVLLHDEKPTVVRQCLGALHQVVLYRSELCDVIQTELEKIDLSKYKDSMSSLIKKDMDELLKMME